MPRLYHSQEMAERKGWPGLRKTYEPRPMGTQCLSLIREIGRERESHKRRIESRPDLGQQLAGVVTGDS